ncbi:MAG: alpha/beta hydrolase [Deltaproteobacteria bacterium]|nr:alpha/beta hydrolase [Deltaproteobacteria bacterium]
MDELDFVSEGNSRCDTASVHWRKIGSGPAIVFLHGFPLSGRTWDEVIRPLSPHFTCYTLDLIGLGESFGSVDVDYSSQGQARAFQATLSQLGVTPYTLVGNDTGGWIARELALIDRQRVARLVLTNTEIPLHRPPWIPMYQVMAQVPGAAIVFQRLLRSRWYLRTTLGFGGCFYDLAHIDGEFHERFVAPLLASRQRIEGLLRFLRNMKFARLDEFKDLHRQLDMPTLFLWGADDAIFPEVHARAMVEQFPQVAGFHSIAKAKLFFYEEQPLQVAQQIEEFARS